MSREIKFRWFDRRTNKIKTDIETTVYLDGSLGTDYDSEWMIFAGQFTGLQCKNQIDLYEGDRCKYHHNTSKWLVSYTFEIIFKDGCFYAYWERMMCGTLEKHFDLLSKIDRSKVKVIGNIHDNLELLTKTH